MLGSAWACSTPKCPDTDPSLVSSVSLCKFRKPHTTPPCPPSPCELSCPCGSRHGPRPAPSGARSRPALGVLQLPTGSRLPTDSRLPSRFGSRLPSRVGSGWVLGPAEAEWGWCSCLRSHTFIIACRVLPWIPPSGRLWGPSRFWGGLTPTCRMGGGLTPLPPGLLHPWSGLTPLPPGVLHPWSGLF